MQLSISCSVIVTCTGTATATATPATATPTATARGRLVQGVYAPARDQKENYLFECDERGEIKRDEEGRPVAMLVDAFDEPGIRAAIWWLKRHDPEFAPIAAPRTTVNVNGAESQAQNDAATEDTEGNARPLRGGRRDPCSSRNENPSAANHGEGAEQAIGPGGRPTKLTPQRAELILGILRTGGT